MSAVIRRKTYRFQEFLSRSAVGIALWCVTTRSGAAPITWFPGAALNEPRSSAAVVVDPAGRILIFGGNPVGSTEVLLYGGNNVQALPSTRVAPGALALASGLFVVYGGKQTNTANSVTSSALSYNTVPSGTDDPNIVSVSPMSSRRYDMAYAADAAGRAYAIGGLGNNNSVLASAERYDPVADAWTSVASLPSGRYHFGAVFDGVNTIYTFGGRTNAIAGTEIAAVVSYSVSDNVWSTMAPMPVATAGSAAIKGADGKIYLIGGTAGGAVTNLVQVYDPGGNTWLAATPLPAAVTAAGGAVDTLGRLVVTGGADGNGTDQAASWVSQRLNVPDAAPVFSNSPPVTANCFVPYTHTARAGGNPQPTYQLTTAPAGMVIDPYSGVVTWTPQPDQFGSNVVTIEADNYAGSATQTVVINTLGPPLSPPTNLAVSGFTTNSVTLTWDPVAYVIGPLTYTVFERHFHPNPRGSGGTFTYATVGGGLNTSATIGGLARGSGHIYVVRASAAGVTSAYSTTVSAVVPVPVVLGGVAALPAGGGFQFTLQIGASESSRIQATTDPTDPASWVDIATNPYTSGTITFTDTNASQFPMRFYRVVTP